jgi:hypothetical protein
VELGLALGREDEVKGASDGTREGVVHVSSEAGGVPAR